MPNRLTSLVEKYVSFLQVRSYRLTHAAFIQLQWPFGQFDIKMFNLM